MLEGRWRRLVLTGALVGSWLAVATACGSKNEGSSKESVSDGAGDVLDPGAANPGGNDPVTETDPGGGQTPPDGGGDVVPPPPGGEDGVVPPPDGGGDEGTPPDAVVSPTLDLIRFWTVDRFFIDGGAPVWVDRSLQRTQLAKAQPDECFYGIGKQIGKPNAEGTCDEVDGVSGILKTNDAYVWGLTKAGNNLFFGTLANTLCLVESGFLGITQGHETPLWVCDPGPYGIGDFRPPNMFRYDLEAGEIVSLNPRTDTLEGAAAEALRRATGGFRSAANYAGVVFLAGPASRGGGINFFAFDADGGALLGVPQTIGSNTCIPVATDAGAPDGAAGDVTAPDPTLCPGKSVYTNVRQWVVANGALYVGVGTSSGGAVLRWMGDKENPYQFVEVGHLPSDAANMIFHTDGRIYVTTWPTDTSPAGLYRSPVVKDIGLTAEDVDALEWTTPLWLATYDGNPEHATVPRYDPDIVSGFTYGGGAIASYQGKLYFGTMHVPFVAALAATEAYEPSSDEALRTALGTHRSVALFEVETDGCDGPKVSLLYGEKYLPTYDAKAGGYRIAYDDAHRTGFVPRSGPSGFGNFFNAYIWSMTVFRDQLFIGTFDWSQVARVELETMLMGGETALPETTAAFLSALTLGFPHEGADLIRISDCSVAAESIGGLGNNRNYGFRNMINDGERMWVGTANPMNLDPLGGWELIQLE